MKQVITDIAHGEVDLDTLKAGASLIPVAKITKVPKVVKAIGNVGKTGSKKGKEGEKIAKSSPAKQTKARDKGKSDSYSYKNGTYEKADYHSRQTTGKKNPAPKDGQFALDNSVPIGKNTTRRVGLDSNGDFVIFDETTSGTFHGHVRTWKNSNGNQGLTAPMKNALYDADYIKSPKGSSFKLTDYAKGLIGK